MVAVHKEDFSMPQDRALEIIERALRKSAQATGNREFQRQADRLKVERELEEPPKPGELPN